MKTKGGEILNHVILVGRLTEDPELLLTNEQSRMVINLAVPRSYRNSQGIYETDFLRCVLWNGIAKRTKEYCKKGDIVSVRGRLQVRTYENDLEEKKYMTEVIVESISFVSSNHKEKIISEDDCFKENDS